MSGVASRGLVLKNAPDVPAAMVNGPLRNAANCTPAMTRRSGELTMSFSVIACLPRIIIRTCMWSCRSFPTPGASSTTAMPCWFNNSAGPTPDNCSNCGEL